MKMRNTPLLIASFLMSAVSTIALAQDACGAEQIRYRSGDGPIACEPSFPEHPSDCSPTFPHPYRPSDDSRRPVAMLFVAPPIQPRVAASA